MRCLLCGRKGVVLCKEHKYANFLPQIREKLGYPRRVPLHKKGPISCYDAEIDIDYYSLPCFGIYEFVRDYRYADIECELIETRTPLIPSIGERYAQPQFKINEVVSGLNDNEIHGITAKQLKKNVPPEIVFVDKEGRFWHGVMFGHWSQWINKFLVLEEEKGKITKIRYYKRR